ncbi:MAG: hypothetical protein KAU50_11585 [Candidatus Marinimicrobia bacterium]|nr:hypothetical protein [Candidatus Neomarinimicrobiota bacterium]
MRFIPFILSFLLLGAHFHRHGQMVLMLLCLLIPLVLLIRKPWAPIVARDVTWFAALIWIFITVNLLLERLATNQPWIRLVLILSGIVLFTILSGVAINSRKVRNRYDTVTTSAAATKEPAPPAS